MASVIKTHFRLIFFLSQSIDAIELYTASLKGGGGVKRERERQKKKRKRVHGGALLAASVDPVAETVFFWQTRRVRNFSCMHFAHVEAVLLLSLDLSRRLEVSVWHGIQDYKLERNKTKKQRQQANSIYKLLAEAVLPLSLSL